MSFTSERARWDSRFSGEDFHFGTAPNRFLASQQQRLRPGMTALCVADGEGRNSVWLASQGLSVTAFDFSPAGVAKARRLAGQAGVSVDCSVASVAEWEWNARAYDLVVAIFVQFATPEERGQLFAGMISALAPGGLLMLHGYTPKQLDYRTGGPPHVEHLYTEALLRGHFGSLEILDLREHEDVIDEGKGHSGRSALIDLVARKPLS